MVLVSSTSSNFSISSKLEPTVFIVHSSPSRLTIALVMPFMPSTLALNIFSLTFLMSVSSSTPSLFFARLGFIIMLPLFSLTSNAFKISFNFFATVSNFLFSESSSSRLFSDKFIDMLLITSLTLFSTISSANLVASSLFSNFFFK